MLEIDISKIADKSVIESLRLLCSLRSDFSSVVQVMELIEEISKLYTRGKQSDAIQKAHLNIDFGSGKDIDHVKEALYKKYKQEYEDSFNAFVSSGTFVFDDLDIIDYVCFETVPDEIKTSLTGLVQFEARSVELALFS